MRCRLVEVSVVMRQRLMVEAGWRIERSTGVACPISLASTCDSALDGRRGIRTAKFERQAGVARGERKKRAPVAPPGGKHYRSSHRRMPPLMQYRSILGSFTQSRLRD